MSQRNNHDHSHQHHHSHNGHGHQRNSFISFNYQPGNFRPYYGNRAYNRGFGGVGLNLGLGIGVGGGIGFGNGVGFGNFGGGQYYRPYGYKPAYSNYMNNYAQNRAYNLRQQRMQGYDDGYDDRQPAQEEPRYNDNARYNDNSYDQPTHQDAPAPQPQYVPDNASTGTVNVAEEAQLFATSIASAMKTQDPALRATLISNALAHAAACSQNGRVEFPRGMKVGVVCANGEMGSFSFNDGYRSFSSPEEAIQRVTNSMSARRPDGNYFVGPAISAAEVAHVKSATALADNQRTQSNTHTPPASPVDGLSLLTDAQSKALQNQLVAGGYLDQAQADGKWSEANKGALDNMLMDYNGVDPSTRGSDAPARIDIGAVHKTPLSLIDKVMAAATLQAQAKASQHKETTPPQVDTKPKASPATEPTASRAVGTTKETAKAKANFLDTYAKNLSFGNPSDAVANIEGMVNPQHQNQKLEINELVTLNQTLQQKKDAGVSPASEAKLTTIQNSLNALLKAEGVEKDPAGIYHDAQHGGDVVAPIGGSKPVASTARGQ